MSTKRTQEEIQGEINALKSLLVDTDYQSNKMIEGLISTMQDASAVNFISRFVAWLRTAITDFGEIIRKRAEWRLRINELEEELKETEE